jgi:hypothetical protein
MKRLTLADMAAGQSRRRHRHCRGLVVTASDAISRAPMMAARPAFPGSALWLPGHPMAVRAG